MPSFDDNRPDRNRASPDQPGTVLELVSWGTHLRLVEQIADEWHLIHRVPVHQVAHSKDALRQCLDIFQRELELRQNSKSPRKGLVLLGVPGVQTTGFETTVLLDGDKVLASFGGLEQEFATIEEALIWVERAFSGDYRLKVTERGGLAVEWRLEPVLEGAGSNEVLASGLVTLLGSFRRSTISYRRNTF